MRINLYTCVTDRQDYVGLHYILDAWDKAGFINRIQIPREPDGRYISWVGRIGLLALEPSDVTKIGTPYEFVLACQYRQAWLHLPKVLPWNFYSRCWPDYAAVLSEPPRKRTTRSIFSGTIRGVAHERHKWINSTEVFHHKRAGTWRGYNTTYPRFSDYYRALASARFGLCPMGDVGVCQREIETMGMGCVPIFTPGVEYLYHKPPIENTHFLFASNPGEMNAKIDGMSQQQREFMSHACQEYFNRYCSPEGLWKTVLETIDRYGLKVG